jgi:hypothetical protein
MKDKNTMRTQNAYDILLFAYVVLILYMVWMIKFMAGLEVEVKK